MPKGGTKERWSRPKGYLSRAELCDCSIICFFLCFFFWLLAGLIKVTWPGLHFEPLLCGHAWPRKMFSHQMQLFGQKEIQSLDACSRTFAQRRRHLRRRSSFLIPLSRAIIKRRNQHAARVAVARTSLPGTPSKQSFPREKANLTEANYAHELRWTIKKHTKKRRRMANKLWTRGCTLAGVWECRGRVASTCASNLLEN